MPAPRSRISPSSSVTMSRAASLWPAAAMRSASVCAGFVVGQARVSETVSTAMPTGMNGAALVKSPSAVAPDPASASPARTSPGCRRRICAAAAHRPRAGLEQPEAGGARPRHPRKAQPRGRRARQARSPIAGASARAGASRSLRWAVQPVDAARRRCPAPGRGGRPGCRGAQAPRTRPASATGDARIGEHHRQSRQAGKRLDGFADAARPAAAAPARHIGKSAPSAEPEPARSPRRRPPGPGRAKRAQRRGRVARAAADAGGDRQVLVKRRSRPADSVAGRAPRAAGRAPRPPDWRRRPAPRAAKRPLTAKRIPGRVGRPRSGRRGR